jgi:septal ring factor EnvC (AmiA/AmiB activator)
MMKLLVTCLFAMIISVAMVAQEPANSEDLKKKQADIQREIDELKNTLKATHNYTKAGLAQLEMVKKKLRLREKAIGNINHQINIIEGNIGNSKNEIDRLANELDTLKAQYASTLINAYKNRRNYDYLNYIFSAPNFYDALRRMQYFKAYHQYLEEQAVNIKNTQLLLQGKISGLELTRRQKDAVLQKQQEQMHVLEGEKKEKNEIVKELKANEKKIARELTDKKKADQKLRMALQRAIATEISNAQKAAAENTSVTPNNTTTRKEVKKSVLESTPEGQRISGSFEGNKGILPWPVDKAQIKLHYGPYKIEGLEVKGNNPGLTLETEAGAAVKAVFEGEVSRIIAIEDNWTVVVRHGKFFTAYGNLSSVSVTRGEKLTAGTVVGKAAVNKDGNGEIEFILQDENRGLDPEKWIRSR